MTRARPRSSIGGPKMPHLTHTIDDPHFREFLRSAPRVALRRAEAIVMARAAHAAAARARPVTPPARRTASSTPLAARLIEAVLLQVLALRPAMRVARYRPGRQR